MLYYIKKVRTKMKRILLSENIYSKICLKCKRFFKFEDNMWCEWEKNDFDGTCHEYIEFINNRKTKESL